MSQLLMENKVVESPATDDVIEYSGPDYIGNDFVGQHALRKSVNFWVHSYQQSKFLDHLMFIGERGSGKTSICRKIGKALKKPFVEINGSSIKSVDGLVDQVILPYVIDKEITLFIDEFACVNHKVLDWLLTALQYDPATKESKDVWHDGNKYTFNFKSLTFLSGTTNGEKLSTALKSRFRHLEFAPYHHEELTEMVRRYTPGIEYLDNTDHQLASVSRNSPREIALRIANDVQQYVILKSNNRNKFTKRDWFNLRNILSIKPLGITPLEEKLLRILSESPKTLTHLVGCFNMDLSSLRREIELYPLANNLIKINQKREITKKGLDLLHTIDMWKKS